MTTELYLVEVTLRNKERRYLRLVGGPWSTTEWRLIKSRAHATRVADPLVAQALSDEFWRAHWDKNSYNCRSVISVTPRPLPEKPRWEGRTTLSRSRAIAASRRA